MVNYYFQINHYFQTNLRRVKIINFVRPWRIITIKLRFLDNFEIFHMIKRGDSQISISKYNLRHQN